MWKKLNLFILFFIPSCFFPVKEKEAKAQFALYPLVSLTESTRAMRELILQNKLPEFYDPEEWLLLLDNLSPARMAFDMEVYNATEPLVVVCYYQDTSESQSFVSQLKDVATQFENQVKFVIIDADKLFSLAEWAIIQAYPTILFVKNREIVDSQKGVSIDTLKQKIGAYRAP